MERSRKMLKPTHNHGKFPPPEFPLSYNPSVVKLIRKLRAFVHGLLFLSLFLSVIIWTLGADYTQTNNSGREILIDSTGTWFELQNSTLQQIEETELMVGDLISYTFSGEISDIEYSDSYCETDSWNSDDIYGSEECWTSYYTHYRFSFFNKTLETNSESIHDFYFCHRNTCQITMQVKNLSNIPYVLILQAEEVVG